MSKVVKRFIDQEEWLTRLEEELNSTKREGRITYLNILINAIKCQPFIEIESEVVDNE